MSVAAVCVDFFTVVRPGPAATPSKGRHLVVRGDLRTYRIHLGSGNVLMSPDDEYLHLVAVRDRRADKLFLPFDDDPVLSLILTKAFLLADDSRITDETILRQIRGS